MQLYVCYIYTHSLMHTYIHACRYARYVLLVARAPIIDIEVQFLPLHSYYTDIDV